MITELLEKNRSYRRFSERAVSNELLRACINGARLSASAANRQRIRFVTVNNKETCDKIFETLRFAAFLTQWSGPSESERPTAYIIAMTESELDKIMALDMGIAAQSILLTAISEGVGGCIFKSYDKEVLSSILGREGYIPELVIALGYPSEQVRVVEPRDGDLKYYRDESDVHCVPKLSVDDLII